MSDQLERKYGKIPPEVRELVKGLDEMLRKLATEKRNIEANIYVTKDRIAHLLTDIRPGDLVKHDSSAGQKLRHEDGCVYMVSRVYLGYAGAEFEGRKIKKDGTPGQHAVRLYTGLYGELVKVGRYRERKVRPCSK